MSVRDELDRVSVVLAEKLRDLAEGEQADELKQEPADAVNDWTNGVGWGDFTRAAAPR